jgi:hypothetical protein
LSIILSHPIGARGRGSERVKTAGAPLRRECEASSVPTVDAADFEVGRIGETALLRRLGQNRRMNAQGSTHVYEIRSRKDHRGVDLISDALPFGRLWYSEPDAISNAIGYAKFFSRSHHAMIRHSSPSGGSGLRLVRAALAFKGLARSTSRRSKGH